MHITVFSSYAHGTQAEDLQLLFNSLFILRSYNKKKEKKSKIYIQGLIILSRYFFTDGLTLLSLIINYIQNKYLIYIQI